MAFTSMVRSWWDFHRCSLGQVRPTGFFGRHTVWQQPELADAVTALEAGHINSGYVPASDGYIGSRRNCPYGIAGRECLPSGSGCSLHNYCIAYDIEYNYNRHINVRVYADDFDAYWFPAVCKYTLAQVRAIEGIKNTDGEQLWTWLGWAIGDFMHWQINVPYYRSAVDWNTVPKEEVEPDMETILTAYVIGAFASGNPNVAGDEDYWLNTVIPDPARWPEFKDMFAASIKPVIAPDHTHPREAHKHTVPVHEHVGTVRVS